jgi:AGCS family alanine or glycine:cation symporter
MDFMAKVNSIVAAADNWVWGPWMLVFLVGTGIFLSFRLKFLQFWRLGYALKLAMSTDVKSGLKGDVSHFSALMTALAATIGIGNIVGVASAVILGGPGAVFWMWITAIFGMATKYGEAVLAIKFRVTDKKGNMAGGPMYFLERGLNAKWLGILFAIFGVIASFGIGSMTQSNSVANSLLSFHVPLWISGLALTILTTLVIVGGIRKIGAACSVIVPFMAVFYVAVGLVIICMNITQVPHVFSLILTDAFSLKAGFGGLVGATIRYGVARGVFSNEAGLGSAPIAAAAAKTDHPVRQGLVSMTGTFLDTIIVCSINGIIMVMAGLYIGAPDASGAAVLTSQSFGKFLPKFGEITVTASMALFAYSTILGWSYYGERCLYYLTESPLASFVYRVIFSLFIFVGATMKLGLAWDISVVFNGAMAIPNLIGLVALSGIIVQQTKDFHDNYYKKPIVVPDPSQQV